MRGWIGLLININILIRKSKLTLRAPNSKLKPLSSSASTLHYISKTSFIPKEQVQEQEQGGKKHKFSLALISPSVPT